MRSLKELNLCIGEILDVKENTHDVKCMLVKILPQRSSSTLSPNDNNNLPSDLKSPTGTDLKLDSRKGEKGQKFMAFNVKSEVMDKNQPLGVAFRAMLIKRRNYLSTEKVMILMRGSKCCGRFEVGVPHPKGGKSPHLHPAPRKVAPNPPFFGTQPPAPGRLAGSSAASQQGCRAKSGAWQKVAV